MATRKKRNPQTRFVTVVPVGRPLPESRQSARLDKKDCSRLAYRLLMTLDDALRTLMKRRGEMSRYLIESLEAADMRSMDLVDIRIEPKAPEVNLYIPRRLHARVKSIAKTRGVSHNTIVNSAMAHWLAARGLVSIRATASRAAAAAAAAAAGA